VRAIITGRSFMREQSCLVVGNGKFRNKTIDLYFNFSYDN
jgi:hypothetical protein